MKLKTAEKICAAAFTLLLVTAVILIASRGASSKKTCVSVTTVPPENRTAVSENASRDGLVNINTAGEEQLEALPGIGPKLAGRIVEYRQEYGGFVSPDELMDVSGIGPATYEKLKDKITTGD